MSKWELCTRSAEAASLSGIGPMRGPRHRPLTPLSREIRKNGAFSSLTRYSETSCHDRSTR